MPVAISVALTVALGIAPPDGSVTVPLMEPRKVCASSATASENAMRIAVTKRFIDYIPPLRSKLELTAPSFSGRAGERAIQKPRPPQTNCGCCGNPHTLGCSIDGSVI